MSTPIFQVDAFTSKAFSGNPAGVCLLDGPRDAVWMQNVAAEMNLSETAFVYREKDGFRLRWFTPKVEVKLCGHATLATSHTLWNEGVLKRDETARFNTLSGLLTASQNSDRIELDFPARPVQPQPAPVGLVEALGATPFFTALTGEDWLVELDNAAAVRAVTPDFKQLAKVEARGIAVTARSDDKAYDFISRFFAPAVGVDEDPVTGSAHCHLTPHWAAKLGKSELVAFQASARGGVLYVRNEGERVRLAGHAVTVLKGALLV